MKIRLALPPAISLSDLHKEKEMVKYDDVAKFEISCAISSKALANLNPSRDKHAKQSSL